MSSRVRRMTLGLATLTLLASLFMVVQGVLYAPEALAACSERTWCDPPYIVDEGECCCGAYRRLTGLWQECYWREWDCTVNHSLVYHGSCCCGDFCGCP